MRSTMVSPGAALLFVVVAAHSCAGFAPTGAFNRATLRKMPTQRGDGIARNLVAVGDMGTLSNIQTACEIAGTCLPAAAAAASKAGAAKVAAAVPSNVAAKMATSSAAAVKAKAASAAAGKAAATTSTTKAASAATAAGAASAAAAAGTSFHFPTGAEIAQGFEQLTGLKGVDPAKMLGEAAKPLQPIASAASQATKPIQAAAADASKAASQILPAAQKMLPPEVMAAEKQLEKALTPIATVVALWIHDISRDSDNDLFNGYPFNAPALGIWAASVYAFSSIAWKDDEVPYGPGEYDPKKAEVYYKKRWAKLTGRGLQLGFILGGWGIGVLRDKYEYGGENWGRNGS